MIPKVIHFVWLGSPVPLWAKENIKTFRDLNPDYDIRIHTSFPQYFPNKLWKLVCQLDHLASKSDILRYFLLLTHGGYYFDVDMVCLNSINYLQTQDSFLAKDGAGANCYAMGSQVRSPLFRDILKKVETKTPPFCKTTFGPDLVKEFSEAAIDRKWFGAGDNSIIAKHLWGVDGSSAAKSHKDLDELMVRFNIGGTGCVEPIEISTKKEYEYVMGINPRIPIHYLVEVEEFIIQEIRRRRDYGREKYGTSMEREDLSVSEWLQHAKEELLDGAIYIEKCIRKVKQYEQENSSRSLRSGPEDDEDNDS